MANSYGTANHVHEEEGLFIPRIEQRPATSQMPWMKLLVGAAVGVAAVGFGVTVQSSLAAQQQLILQLQQQIEAMHAAVTETSITTDATTVLSKGLHKKNSYNPSSAGSLPSKFAVNHVTPLKTQDERGTCWDFATIAVLEHSYRTQGIANGWLDENEFLALSEQAYGAEILRLCAGPPGSPQQAACLVSGDEIWNNSTEGGEVAVLYYLMNGLENSIFPTNLCPYFPDDGNDSVCPALTQAKRRTNPLKLTINEMETFYDQASIKQALVRDSRAMGFSTPMPYITHYYPCIGEVASLDKCNPASVECTLCPPELAATTCCIPINEGLNYNMKGEYITSHFMANEGGHAMTLVGYNDLYRTKQGFTGGYILKNSWWDGIHPALGPKHPRGSHSIKYWMQEISDWEEARMCPNSYDPDNWYQCGNTGEVIHSHADAGVNVPLPSKRSATASGGEESCLTEETALYAKTSMQPLHLKCTDANYCLMDANVTYYTRNSTQWGDRMQIMCFLEYNTVTEASSEICLPPLMAQTIAYIFSPIDEEVLENDPDVCGYYFYPYEVEQQYKSKFGNFYVNNFDITWHPQSYASNHKDYPELDYSDVVASTRKQNEYDFVGPFPFARVVDAADLPKVEL